MGARLNGMFFPLVATRLCRASVPLIVFHLLLCLVLRRLKQRKISSLGIASFGPVDLNTKSATYVCSTRTFFNLITVHSSSRIAFSPILAQGHITSTPKTLWKNTDIVGHFRSLGVPIGFQTDVNAAALSELHLGGHGADVASCCYVTIGTGVGTLVFLLLCSLFLVATHK